MLFKVFKMAFLFALFATCVLEAAALWQEPMGVVHGASYCRGMKDVPNNGYDAALPLIPIPPYSKTNIDKRNRWSVNIDLLHGSFTVLHVNRDGRGQWQNHLKLHRSTKNWSGNLIVKASYAAKQGDAKIDHFFVIGIGMDEDVGCVLTTINTPTQNYPIEWSYQLNGYKLRRE